MEDISIGLLKTTVEIFLFMTFFSKTEVDEYPDILMQN